VIQLSDGDLCSLPLLPPLDLVGREGWREEEAAGRERREALRRAGEGLVTTRERGGRLVPGEIERQGD
jgi:hypothetical protein